MSLRPMLEGRPQTLPAAYTESRLPWLAFGWAPLRAVLADGWKLVAVPRPELYEIERDPGERSNVIGAQGDRARSLMAEMRRIEAGRAGTSVGAPDEAAAKLRALGYLSGGGSAAEPPETGLADPKDRLEEKSLLEMGESLFLKSDYAAALSTFGAILKLEPENPFALLRAAAIFKELGKYPEAIRHYERAVARDPTNAEARFGLAEALSNAGRNEKAIEAWRATLALQPGRPAAWSNLGSCLAEDMRIDEALAAYRRAVELEPVHPTYRENLATLLLRQALVAATAGREEEARTLVGEAVMTFPSIRKRALAEKRLAPLLPR